MGCGYGFVDTLYIHVVCVCVWVCVCMCETSEQTDETGTSKDTPQMPVISMGTLIDVPTYLLFDII